MKRSFLIGVAWSGASSWIEQALNLIIFVAIARLIGPEQFGIAGMAMAFLLLCEILVRETLTEEIIQRKTVGDGFLEASGAVLLGAGILIALILCGIAPIAAASYQEPLVAWLILASSPVILMISGSGVSTALLRRRLAFDVLAFQAILGAIVGGIVGVGLALLDYGAWALIGQRLAMTFVNFTISIIAAKWVPTKIPRRADFKLIGGLGPRVVAIRTAATITTQTPTIALGIFVGANAVAIYSLSLRLVEVLTTLFVAPLRTVSQSVIAEMQRRGQSSGEFILEVSQLVALLACASLVGLAVIGNPAIKLVFGEEWVAAAWVVPWICLAGFARSITLVQESYLLALDRVRRLVRVVIVETMVGVVLVLAAASYGPAAAAAAFAARALLFLPLRTSVMLSPEKLPAAVYLRWVILIPVALAFAMALVVSVWRFFMLGQMPDILYLALTISIGISAYLVLLVALVPAVVERAKQFIQSARTENPGVSES